MGKWPFTTLFAVALAAAAVVLTGGLALVLYTLPGIRRLPKETRTTVDGVTTIDDAVAKCRQSAVQGWDLAEYAQQLAAHKFTYSRRNPWDSINRAFERGMGYCQQQALALKRIYDGLGIDSQLVYAKKCGFPPKVVHGMADPALVSPHSWLRVRIGDKVKDVCCGNRENRPGKVHFQVLSEVKPLPGWLQPITHLSSVVVNVRRDNAALRRAREEKRVQGHSWALSSTSVRTEEGKTNLWPAMGQGRAEERAWQISSFQMRRSISSACFLV